MGVFVRLEKDVIPVEVGSLKGCLFTYDGSKNSR